MSHIILLIPETSLPARSNLFSAGGGRCPFLYNNQKGKDARISRDCERHIFFSVKNEEMKNSPRTRFFPSQLGTKVQGEPSQKQMVGQHKFKLNNLERRGFFHTVESSQGRFVLGLPH